jgi:hypothetical protein
VLYADSAALDADAINLEALEMLVRVAGMTVELLSIPRPAPAERPARVEPQAPAKREAATAPPKEESVPAAEAADDDETPTLVQEAAAVEEEQTPATRTDGWGAAPEQEQQQQQQGAQTEASNAPATEAPGPVAEPAPQPAASQPSTFSAPLGAARRYGSTGDADLPVDVSDEEKRLHNDARRFARLLVSEIKLYNEQKVKEGRSQGNIYERLREDIDRSRQMYDKRVAPPVAARYDYFHQELVNTLAEGDQAKLGDSYPGATVSA